MEDIRPVSALSNELCLLLEELEADCVAESSEKRVLLCIAEIDMDDPLLS
jgi:hypothetical protein